jgi:hypothetical protein
MANSKTALILLYFKDLHLLYFKDLHMCCLLYVCSYTSSYQRSPRCRGGPLYFQVQKGDPQMLFGDIFTGAVFCVLKANQLLKGSTSGNPIIGSSLLSPSLLTVYSCVCFRNTPTPPPPTLNQVISPKSMLLTNKRKSSIYAPEAHIM